MPYPPLECGATNIERQVEAQLRRFHKADDPGDELPIPGREFGFRRLIRAQAAGDYEALRERGRRVCRVAL